MADEPAGRTSLGVLHEILNNLGDSNTYITVVDALEALLNVLGSGGIGQAVSDWLEAHPEASTTVQNGSITLLKLANDVKAAIDGKAASSDLQALADNLSTLAQTVAEKADASDLDDKADIDGYYSQLTAGLAENLIGRGDAVPAEYLYRTAGGTADIEDGIATIDCIKGNTLVWNQMVKTPYQSAAATDWNGVTVSVDSNNYVTASGTASRAGSWGFCGDVRCSLIAGHKMLLRGIDVLSGGVSFRVYSSDTATTHKAKVTTTDEIFTINTTSTKLSVYIMANSNSEVSFGGRPQLFDLTLMFGEGNEPATVEEFEAMFPLPYYPYSAPKLLPVDMRGIETVGFNLWDEELEVGVYNSTTGAKSVSTDYVRSANKIHVFPNTTYCFKVVDKNVTVYFYTYDESGAYRQTSIGISSGGTFVVPNGIHYFAFALKVSQYGSTTYQNDICINLSWSGYRNGEYEEHWSAERPIDTSRFFPTGLKKVGDKADALYADHYETVVGVADADASWNYGVSGPNENGIYYIGMPTGLTGSSFIANLSSNLPISTGIFSQSTQREFACNTATVFYRFPSDHTPTMAEALADLRANNAVCYFPTTPTTVPIDPPLNLSYKVSDFGTERIMVDETADAPQSAPVPMEVEYGINAIDTIRRLPTEYQSHKSMGQLTAALESSLGIDITETWDETEQRYEYDVTSFELANDAVTPNSLSDEVLHGQYPSVSVGSADAFTGADETAQWATRKSTGSGAATVRSVQGAAVAWNQLSSIQSKLTNGGVSFTEGTRIVSGNKYLLKAKATVGSGTASLTVFCNNGSNVSQGSISASSDGYVASIFTATIDGTSTGSSSGAQGNAWMYASIGSGATGFDDIQLFDLTTMFGAGNEPATVAEFERMYPEAYYPYSAPTLKPVQIAGIASTDAQGGELDSVEWTAQTLRAAGSVRDELTADELVTRVGVVDMGTLTWECRVYGGTNPVYMSRANFPDAAVPASIRSVANVSCAEYTASSLIAIGRSDKQVAIGDYWYSGNNLYIHDTAYTDAATFKTAMDGVLLFYELATPTTTPISPALPMTYKVQQGGTEAIIVPEGEVSAVPVLTIAEGESAADVVMDALACIATPDGPTATANHSVGTYLTMQGKLYKVTSAIAVSETITAGTNVTETTVMAELLALTQ